MRWIGERIAAVELIAQRTNRGPDDQQGAATLRQKEVDEGNPQPGAANATRGARRAR
jgi:hypothetical protein